MKKIRKLPLKKSKDLEGMTKEEKVKQIISRLEKLFPGSKIALNYSSPWELFVAVVLSAQTTDKQVNVVTHDLFAKYKTLEDYVNTPLEEFQNDVKRLAKLFGLTDETDPNKIERDLMEITPKKDWFMITYLLIDYGRKYCTARCKHTDCPLKNYIIK